MSVAYYKFTLAEKQTVSWKTFDLLVLALNVTIVMRSDGELV
jgi:hypothetical protein